MESLPPQPSCKVLDCKHSATRNGCVRLAHMASPGRTTMGRSTASICLTDRDDMRLQNAYARGSDVYSQLGIGMQERRIDSFSLQRKPRKSNVRLAVVMPWVVDAAPSSTCKSYATKPEVKAGARCEAFFSLPASWPYWLASAGRNAAIADFLIFHEPDLKTGFFQGAGATLTLPSNVLIHEVANLTALYRAQMDERCVKLNPDKVKDFKPVIGHVFEAFLRPYTHWAFGDVDVVYGDLSRFLTPEILSHDIVTFRTDDICASMTKTVFAGQLTVFANNEWSRLLYRGVPNWLKVACNERYMFFDERSMPTHAVRIAPKRIAMAINQLSDRLFTRSLESPNRRLWAKTGLLGLRRHLLWRGSDGRLLLVDGWGAGATSGSTTNSCVVSEAALVHLQQHKFKHYGAMPSSDPIGFVFDRARGFRSGSALNESGDSTFAALLRKPQNEFGDMDRCSNARRIQSIMDRSMF